MTAHRPIRRTPAEKRGIQSVFAFPLCCALVLFHAPPIRAAGAPELFAKHCASCHGKDGKAQTPIARKLGVKDLTQSHVTDGEIEKQVTEGKKDERGIVKMPPFKDKLSSQEIQSLIVLVKSFRK